MTVPAPVPRVRDAVYALCRAVVRSGTRGPIKSLLTDLRGGRGNVGYHATQAGGQFAGFLAIHGASPRMAAVLGTLPSLADHEVRLLSAAHGEMVAMNGACLAALAAVSPEMAAVADPYLGGPPLPPIASATQTPQAALLDPVLVNELARAYASSKLVKNLLTTPSIIRDAYSQAVLVDSVAVLDALLRQPKVDTEGQAWSALAFQYPPDFPPKLALAFHAGIAGLRASLRCANQMIFQAMEQDRIATLDDDCTIALKGPRSNVAEWSLTVTMQPTRSVPHLTPGQVVMVSHSIADHLKAMLGEVIATHSQHSQRGGSIERVTLHLLDDELNPSPLFASLTRV